MKKIGQFLWQNKVVVLLILVAIGAGVFVKFINHPIMEYSEIERQTIEQIAKQTEPYTESAQDLKQRLSQDAYETESIITGNINMSEYSRTSMLLRAALANSRIVVQSQSKPQSNESSSQVQLQLQRNNLLEADIYQNDLYTAIRLPFYPEPVGIKNDRLGDFLERNNNQAWLDEVPQSFNVDEFFSIESRGFLSLISEVSQYETYTEHNVTYQNKDYHRFTMNLTNEQVQSLVQQLTNELQIDEENPVYKYIEKLKQAKFPEGLAYEAYYTDDYVEKRLLTGVVELEGQSYPFEWEVETNVNQNNYDIVVQGVLKQNQPVEFLYEAKGQPNEKGYQVKRKVDIQSSDRTKLDWHTDYTDGLQETEFQFNPPYNLSNVEGNLDISSNINHNQGQKQYDGSLNFSGLSVKFKINQDIQFNKAAVVEKMDANNVLFLHKQSDKEHNEFMRTIRQLGEEYADQLIKQFNPFE
ncbi:hypothetical protein [Aquisalibacillus elongatus]|uniref:Uncharacterized protein n=1 Tax=Aquisalibacillus elongatus TaxID=485577 RepID=A0A3N5AYS9_9BACI|nr:hypothetical protein [Aquisalibacillus elongatus]RPF50129.1 hypothetical protein EDC24_2947 [Aquisalibacillus elongatus]